MYGMQYQQCMEYSERDYASSIARWAKTELLKEKVKQRIDAKHGKKLDRIADLVVEMLEETVKVEDAHEAKVGELEDAFSSLYSESDEE